MSHNENVINRLVGETKSSKFQALQVQLFVTAISTQIFSENTIYWLYNKERSFYIRISPTLVYAWSTTACSLVVSSGLV